MDQATGSPQTAKTPNQRASWETERVWKKAGAHRRANFGTACYSFPGKNPGLFSPRQELRVTVSTGSESHHLWSSSRHFPLQVV